MVANITFLSFLLFSMCQSIQVVVNTWLNFSFLHYYNKSWIITNTSDIFQHRSVFFWTTTQGSKHVTEMMQFEKKCKRKIAFVIKVTNGSQLLWQRLVNYYWSSQNNDMFLRTSQNVTKTGQIENKEHFPWLAIMNRWTR